MERKIIFIAAILGIIGIVLGAFGAHKLKELLNPVALNSFETGVRYQIYQAFFLFFIGTTALLTDRVKIIIFYLTITGVLLFSGSIYLLSTRELTNIDFKLIGILTPIGGLLMILAWTFLMLNILKKRA